MDYPISVPSVGLVGGKFVDENPGTGTPGSLIPSQWGNAVTEEILNVLAAAAVTPDEFDNGQLLLAIGRLARHSQAQYAVAAGTANAISATFAPAVSSLSDGMVLKCKAIGNNTGPATFNPNGLGAKAIVGGAHIALQGGEIVAGGDVWLQYNVSIGSGSWVLIASTGGATQIPKGLKTNQAVNLSQLGSFSNLLGTSTSTVLGLNNFGQIIVVTAAGTVQTLPPVAGMPPGTAIAFAAWATCTIKGSGSEQIADAFGDSSNTLQLAQGEQVTVASNGIGWYVASSTKPAGRLLNVRTFTSSSTYIPTPGTASIVVEVVGGGGGSGGCAATSASQYAASAGAASGSFAKGRITSGFSGVAVSVGSAGTVGAAGGPGGSGGTSSFGALVSAPGGPGSATGAAISAQFFLVAGTPSGPQAGGGSIFNSSGEPGSVGFTANVGGNGGSTPYGSGGLGSGITGLSGSDATGYGSGAGGICRNASQAAIAGFPGRPGVVIITEYSS
ncbi:hypothetical protein J3P84_23450 [Pseudomonas sp. Z1-29]|uniref:hypothetical protein n=1 Tax=Pseudomonas sp. Z1-29 TaxID=2817410 RepID=UPI003DAA216E